MSLPEELPLAVYGSLGESGAGAEFNFAGDKALLPCRAHSLSKSMFGSKPAKVCSYTKVGDIAMGAAALSASEELKTARLRRRN